MHKPGFFSSRRAKLLLLGGIAALAAVVLGVGLVQAATQAGPTVSPTTVRTCVNLSTGTVRVIQTLPTDLQWASGKNPRSCAKEDEQEVDLMGGLAGPTGATGPTLSLIHI